MLKDYYIKVQAVRITKKNWSELLKLDSGDGVLDFDTFENLKGEWFVITEMGCEVMPSSRKLIPVVRTVKANM